VAQLAHDLGRQLRHLGGGGRTPGGFGHQEMEDAVGQLARQEGVGPA
jgi:hypothetical protein